MKPHRFDQTMRWRALAAAALALGGLLAAPSAGDASASKHSTPAAHSTSLVRVIVESEPGQTARADRAVMGLGGDVVSTQPSLGTLVVDLPLSAVDELGASSGVRSVTPDSRVRLQTTGTGPAEHPGDLVNVARGIGAMTYWRQGYFGQGVDVALLDSGVLPVEGMLTRNKLVIGPDLSFESQQPELTHLDTFGHGTHMAGIIGGLDRGLTAETFSSDTRFVGMAPATRIVSLKLADAQGNTDVSQVIAAIDWVVTHAKDPGMNIRVLNLSFGTDSTQDYRLDPLAHAAEVAWSSGIVVV
ncbi:MAG: S8 family serine peptidase, partial [Actinomycetes bacterium]